MKTRMIAIAAALMMTATSVVSLAGAESTVTEPATPTAVVETMETVAPDTTIVTFAADAAAPETTVAAPAAETAPGATEAAAPETTVAAPANETAPAAEEAAQPTFTVADVKTHHVFHNVANTFQVKLGRVSRLTKVCLWSTDCRKACTKVRRLSADETLTVVAQSNGWYKVVDSTGRTGFVVRSRVTRV